MERWRLESVGGDLESKGRDGKVEVEKDIKLRFGGD